MRPFRPRHFYIVLLIFALLSPFSGAKDYGKVSSQKVAEDIYLFTTTPYADAGLSGNSLAILSDDGVLVTAEQTAEALDKQNAELAAKIGIKDAETAAAFKDSFLDVFVKRAKRELDGPLGDLRDGLHHER